MDEFAERFVGQIVKATGHSEEIVRDVLSHYHKLQNPRPDTRPAYRTKEIEKMAEQQEVRLLIKMAEQILGKSLVYGDLNLLMSFYDWLNLPISVIEVLLTHCVSIGKKNNRYLEKVAIDWADNGITTVDLAEAYIKMFNVDYREILKALGLSRNDPAPVQVSYMRKWLNEYKFPLELVLEACGKTALVAGGNFKYLDKILTDWHSRGAKTLDDVKSLDDEHKNSKETKSAAKSASRRKSRFAEANKRDWDFDELERMAADYAEKEAEGG